MTDIKEPANLVSRREAIRRVSALMGGVALVGGTAMFTGCRDSGPAQDDTKFVPFTPDEIAYLDEIADTILPDTKTPGAKAAKTGAFMALMVTESYGAGDQKIFRAGMRALDAASKKANNVTFVAATPAQRLALLQALDKEQKTAMDARDAASRKAKADSYLPDQKKENAATTSDAGGASLMTKDSPAHYFRMMKELTLLGYFTSEIGMTKAQQYVESPGRFDPCATYTPGDRAWAGHA